MEKLIWFSYDLQFKGDYEGLYCWLDNHNAKECGNSLASFNYDYKVDLAEELREDLKGNIRYAKHDRIYIIWREESKLKGRFIFGKRKAPPWSGYGTHESEIDEEAQ